jgi:hypothetical protein
MSKMDGLRAMREAKYARAAAGAAERTGQPDTRPTAPRKPRPAVAPPAVDPAPAADVLCGHRAISGRTCTREAGHAAKSHRYS